MIAADGICTHRLWLIELRGRATIIIRSYYGFPLAQMRISTEYYDDHLLVRSLIQFVPTEDTMEL